MVFDSSDLFALGDGASGRFPVALKTSKGSNRIRRHPTQIRNGTIRAGHPLTSGDQLPAANHYGSLGHARQGWSAQRAARRT
jgi:hypothetical protein